MRTTVSLDDDILGQARAIARARRVPLGKVISELMRRGIELRLGDRDGFPVFSVPEDVLTITSANVTAAEDDW